MKKIILSFVFAFVISLIGISVPVKNNQINAQERDYNAEILVYKTVLDEDGNQVNVDTTNFTVTITGPSGTLSDQISAQAGGFADFLVLYGDYTIVETPRAGYTSLGCEPTPVTVEVEETAIVTCVNQITPEEEEVPASTPVEDPVLPRTGISTIWPTVAFSMMGFGVGFWLTSKGFDLIDEN